MKKRRLVFGKSPALYCSFLWALNYVALLRKLPYPLVCEYFVPGLSLFRVRRLVGRRYHGGTMQLDAWLEIFPNLGVDRCCTAMDKIFVVNGYVDPVCCEIGVQLDGPRGLPKPTSYVELFVEGRWHGSRYMMQRNLVRSEISELHKTLDPIVDFSFLTEAPLYRHAFVRNGVFVVEEDYGALVAV